MAQRTVTADNVAVYCAYDEIVQIDKLQPNPKNPNTHGAEQIAMLAEIIKKAGWRNSVTVSALTGFIVKGHGRLLAAEDLVPAAEIDDESVTQPGDVWILGRHKLICGDATNPETYAALMGDELAKLIITDPPYNVDYTGGTEAKLKIKNDSMEDNAFREFLTAAFKGMARHGAPGAAVYIWHADSEGLNFRTAMAAAGIPIKQCLVWVKNSMTLGRQDYQWKHEPCLYGWIDGGSHYFIDDRKQTTVYEAQEIELDKLKKSELIAFLQRVISPPQAHKLPCFTKRSLYVQTCTQP